MTLAVRNVFVDCDNDQQAQRVAAFWSAALGVGTTREDGFLHVGMSQTTGTNAAVFTSSFRAAWPGSPRLQLLFEAADGTLSEEVDRLIELGATLIDDRRISGHHGAGWVILADPMGNPFRVQSNPHEVAALEALLSEGS